MMTLGTPLRMIRSVGGFPGSPLVRLHASNVGGLGLIPGWGTRFHMLQPRVQTNEDQEEGGLGLLGNPEG